MIRVFIDVSVTDQQSVNTWTFMRHKREKSRTWHQLLWSRVFKDMPVNFYRNQGMYVAVVAFCIWQGTKRGPGEGCKSSGATLKVKMFSLIPSSSIPIGVMCCENSRWMVWCHIFCWTGHSSAIRIPSFVLCKGSFLKPHFEMPFCRKSPETCVANTEDTVPGGGCHHGRCFHYRTPWIQCTAGSPTDGQRKGHWVAGDRSVASDQ